MSVDLRRQLALATLLSVHRGKSLAVELQRMRSSMRDDQAAATIEELVKGALQWQGRYDHLIRCFSERRATADPIVRAVLHLAIHELIQRDRVPDYAVLHQAGELLRSSKRPRSIGYVNALLQEIRRYAANKAPLERLDALHHCFVGTATDTTSYLSAWWSHPLWQVRRWCEHYGEGATADLLKWANTPPPITLHVLPGHDVVKAQAALADCGLKAGRVDGFPRALRLAERLGREHLRTVLQNIDGLLVQDAGAQSVLDWLTRDGADLGAVTKPVMDLCAAPGGKAVHLRTLLPQGCLLVSMDLHPGRLNMVRQNRDRLKLSQMELLVGNGIQAPLRPGCCSAVLLDGPCSGTGVIRHHPEGRWRLHPDILRHNAERLLQLASAGADLLVDKGRLYYATCSLEPEENEAVIEALLHERGDFTPDPDPDGIFMRQWLPWRDATDGFFAARLRRMLPQTGGRFFEGTS